MIATNPFQYLDIVEPTEFVGRWPLVQELADHLVSNRGNSQAIIAGRRCGKSSLLYALAHHLCQPATALAGSWRPLPLFIDLKAAPFAAAEEFFAYTLLELCDLLTTSRARDEDGWPPSIRLDTPTLQQITQQPALSLRDFTGALAYLLPQLATPAQNVRLILLLDEVDETLDHPWTAALFNQLRTLVYSGNLRRQVRLVMAGSRRFLEQVSSRGSPLNNILRRNFLAVLNETSFYELSARALALPQPVAASIWRQSGGHPFLAQYLLHHLWTHSLASGLATATAADVERFVIRFHAEHTTDLQGWTTGVEPIGLRVYNLLPQTPAWLTEDQLAAQLPDPALEVKRGLIALCYHGLARHTNWTQYQRAGDLFHTWFTRYEFLTGVPAALPVTDEPAITDQRGQHVGIQVNIVGDFLANPTSTPSTALAALDQLLAAVNAAAATGQLTEETATDIAYHIRKTLQQARQPDASSAQMVAHLQAAHAIVPNLAGDLVCAIDQTMRLVQIVW